MDDEHRSYSDALPEYHAQPRPLGLDRIFERAAHWHQRGPSAPLHPPSPPPSAAHLTLPLPDAHEISPLAGLFTYPDLVPEVLAHLSHPRDLAVGARVCREWARVCRRRLYRDIWVRPWEDAPKRKLLRLFETLSEHPELCESVASLDIRFFPLDLQGESRSLLGNMILEALRRMRNLSRLVWTRDRSLSTDLFEVITRLPCLEHLEISGHSTRLFDPSLLGHMPALRHLRIMMPDPTFRSVLPAIAKELDRRTNGGLWGLALICRSFNFINDALLHELAPYLGQLKRLQLVGHTKVTRAGVYAVLEEARGLEELVLDAAPHSDLVDLTEAPPLPSLSTFSLSFPAPPKQAELVAEDMPLFRRMPLRALELNLTAAAVGERRQRVLSRSALLALQSRVDFASLTRLALLDLLIDAEELRAILAAAPLLEELYVCLASPSALKCSGFEHSRLRIFHANAPESARPSREQLADVAACMPVVEQVGSMNRVYEVQRYHEKGQRVVELARWSQITTPGYFLVWRT
ncbi:uncharacterized protein COLE_04837 [Cutaneotrichosporon oleaginosum]|nr:hypothetical protein COLE_04837 [Cutaneotrichosporon oleaginosum]